MVFRQANIESADSARSVVGEAAGIISERQEQYSPPKRSQNLDLIDKPTLLAQAATADCRNQGDKDCTDNKPHGGTTHTNGGWNYWLYNHLFGSSSSTAKPIESSPGAEVKEPATKPTMNPTVKPGETHVSTPVEPHTSAPARPGIFGRYFGGHSSAG